MNINIREVVRFLIMMFLCEVVSGLTNCYLPCKNPQPRVINTTELFNLPTTSSVKPVEMVVYRKKDEKWRCPQEHPFEFELTFLLYPLGCYGNHCKQMWIRKYHQCDKTTGCCRDNSPQKYCTVKLKETVDTEIIIIRKNQTLEKMKYAYENHTECYCESTANPIK